MFGRPKASLGPLDPLRDLCVTDCRKYERGVKTVPLYRPMEDSMQSLQCSSNSESEGNSSGSSSPDGSLSSTTSSKRGDLNDHGSDCMCLDCIYKCVNSNYIVNYVLTNFTPAEPITTTNYAFSRIEG